MGSVPIPAAPEGANPGAVVLVLFRQLHQELRDEVAGLTDDALNWVPTPGANSIATIVTHLVGSETETLRSVAGVACERDRDAEFAQRRRTSADLLLLLDEADGLLVEVWPRMERRRLTAEIPLPTLPSDELRPGLTWLVANYGHAREHVGQVQLTNQLYRRVAAP